VAQEGQIKMYLVLPFVVCWLVYSTLDGDCDSPLIIKDFE
jgi:hypothetical protein